MINLQKIIPLLTEQIELSSEEVSLCVDNRDLSKGKLFIAIVGEQYNPLMHLDLVVSSGCRFVLYEKNQIAEELISEYSEKIIFLPVKDLVTCIGRLGELVAQQFKERGGRIIAISGSNGKTTTKEMLFHLLSESFGSGKVICTQKNYNNHLGVPFTLFQINSLTEFAIIELGSNAPGEIEFLCQMIKANIGMTTNIGDTHLEFFDSRENVFKEEGILANYCEEIFFVNNDDEYLKTIPSDPNKITFGTTGKNYKFEFFKDGIKVNNYRLHNSQITGQHNFLNLGLAFSISHFIDPDRSEEFIKAAQSFKPTANRSQWTQIRNTKTFLDAYNANPSSMKVALVGFSDFLESQNSSNSDACVILGDMNELGNNSAAMHADVGNFALEMQFAQYIFVGKFNEDYTKTSSENIHQFETTQQAINFLKDRLESYKYLFIKGSRSLQLERMTDIK